MNVVSRVTLAILASIAALTVPGAVLAKGLPADITISGPGLTAPLEVTDPFAAAALGTATLMDTAHELAPPPLPAGPFYEIARDGFDRVRYYPGPSLNHTYIYYEGLFNGSSGYDRHWYPVSPAGDAAMRLLLVTAGVNNPDVGLVSSLVSATTAKRARSAIAADAPSSAPALPITVWLAFVGVAGLLMGSCATVLIRASIPPRRAPHLS